MGQFDRHWCSLVLPEHLCFQHRLPAKSRGESSVRGPYGTWWDWGPAAAAGVGKFRTAASSADTAATWMKSRLQLSLTDDFIMQMIDSLNKEQLEQKVAATSLTRTSPKPADTLALTAAGIFYSLKTLCACPKGLASPELSFIQKLQIGFKVLLIIPPIIIRFLSLSAYSKCTSGVTLLYY